MLENFNIDKSTSCCFTGHRNRDLPFFGDRDTQGMKCLVSNLQLLIEKSIKDGYSTFISGMAQGIDLLCAEIVHNLITRKGLPIKLICALPYKSQLAKEKYSSLEKYIYSMILDSCSQIIYVCDNYKKDCYKLRNQFMVDNSSRLIGVYKEKIKGSGTLQTMNMAKSSGHDIHIIELDKNPVYYIKYDKCKSI